MPECIFCGKDITVSVLKNIQTHGNLYNISECVEYEIGMTHPFPSDNELAKLYSSGNYRTSTGKRFGIIIESLIYLGGSKNEGRLINLSTQERFSTSDVGAGCSLM